MFLVSWDLAWNVNEIYNKRYEGKDRQNSESEEYSWVIDLGISFVSVDVNLQLGILFSELERLYLCYLKQVGTKHM